MRVTRANFASMPWLKATAEGMVRWRSGNTHEVLEEGQMRDLTLADDAELPIETGPFSIADFGAVDRLSWAVGACAVRGGTYAYWGQRYACSVKPDTLWLWDATRPVVATLTAPGLFQKEQSYGLTTRALRDWLWFQHGEAVCTIALSDLAALFERSGGAVVIDIVETYPQREQSSSHIANILEVATKMMTVKVDERIMAMPRIDGAVVGMEFELLDEIGHRKFHAAKLPGHEPVILNPLPPSATKLRGELVIEPAIDPAAGLIAVGEAPTRQADLDRLFEALADDPEDTATREILIDLLEDSGEPYASALHELIAGNADKRDEALGPFASYLTAIEYHGGLWASATLAPSAPRDPDIGDAIANDHRLGFLHTLRIGDGPFAVYARLVAAPRAVGLRHVDVPNGQVLAALIAGKRTHLTQLSNVKFATRAVIDGLGDRTFDRVVKLHTETTAAIVAKQLQFFIRDEAGFFARAPRHLILTVPEKLGDIEDCERYVRDAWPKLPLAALTVGALTLTR